MGGTHTLNPNPTITTRPMALALSVRERQASSADLWLHLFNSAFSSKEGHQWPPESWTALNAQGRPLCAVIAWDAPPKALIDAFLSHKALEAKWKPGNQLIPDLRLLIVTLDDEKKELTEKYAKSAGGRAWGTLRPQRRQRWRPPPLVRWRRQTEVP